MAEETIDRMNYDTIFDIRVGESESRQQIRQLKRIKAEGKIERMDSWTRMKSLSMLLKDSEVTNATNCRLHPSRSGWFQNSVLNASKIRAAQYSGTTILYSETS